MQNYKRLPVNNQVDLEAECLFRFISGSNDIFNPHAHDYYEIFLTVTGAVTHQINGITEVLPEGCLVFIRPNDVHGYRYDSPKSAQTEYINLTFTRATANELFSFLSDCFPSTDLLSSPMPPKVLLSNFEKEALLREISSLNLVNWSNKSALKIRMRVLLADIFSRYFNVASKQAETNIPYWLTALLSKMETPEHFSQGTDHMIELSGKSREHLCRSLRKYCDISPTEYINDLRINYASNLLVNTNTPIVDICFDCGFSGLSYFYRVFRKHHGTSPRDFREKHQINQ